MAQAEEVIARLQTEMEQAVDRAVSLLAGNGEVQAVAIQRVASMLIEQTARTLIAAADDGREADARTFEAMFDVNAASHHFQSTLRQGLQRAATDIAKDGYRPSCATVLAAARALDAIADILKDE